MRWLGVAIVSCWLAVLAAPAVAGDPEDFNEAVTAYKAGDYQKAFGLYKALAEKGVAEAQFNLGVMHDNGEGTPQDFTKAIQWYGKAAEQNYAWAQFSLGWMYDTGKGGVPQNHFRAFHWYTKAATQGNDWAQFYLGRMYHLGHGVSKDYVKAYAWRSVATRQGAKKGTTRPDLDTITKKLTPGQLAEGQELAAEYWEKYVVPFRKN